MRLLLAPLLLLTVASAAGCRHNADAPTGDGGADARGDLRAPDGAADVGAVDGAEGDAAADAPGDAPPDVLFDISTPDILVDVSNVDSWIAQAITHVEEGPNGSASAAVVCSANEVAVSGGVSCGGYLQLSAQTSAVASSWSGSCLSMVDKSAAVCMYGVTVTLAPSMTVAASQANSTCGIGKTLVGGGADCGGSRIFVAKVNLPSNRFEVTCENGTATARAVCVGGDAAGKISPTIGVKGTGTATAACAKRQRLVGGGCEALAGTYLRGSLPAYDQTAKNWGWRCEGQHTSEVIATALCIETP